MKLNKPLPAIEISNMIGAEIYGNENQLVSGLNEIHRVENGDLIFVDHPKYFSKALSSKASTVLINEKVDFPKGKTIIVCGDPFDKFNFLINRFFPFCTAKTAISKTAKIGEGTKMQPNVFIGNNVVIGKNCTIHSNVSIYDNTVIGNDVTIHSGTVIGGDAFYFQRRKEGYRKLTSAGSVAIGNSVEIGSNCTIDKGVCAETLIGDGTKLDCMVHVGHDTIVGVNCLFAAQVGVSGASIIEDDVILWGQVGVSSNITIGKGAVVLGQSGVTKSIKGGKTYFGTPAIENREKLKELVAIRKLSKKYRNL
jgi:UDP-3-O-[3-hydroxymyristoyl] glucosamine N-acyltransferase